MFETRRLYLVEATEEDIDVIIKLEKHKENSDFVCNEDFNKHKLEIEDNNYLLLIIRNKVTKMVVGFALIYLDLKSDVFELRRIVISDKGKGYGKETLKALIKYAFEKKNCNRFWLDVYTDNIIGINLYESLGMHCDGILRESYKAERGYLNQRIYSILKNEYNNSCQSRKY